METAVLEHLNSAHKFKMTLRWAIFALSITCLCILIYHVWNNMPHAYYFLKVSLVNANWNQRTNCPVNAHLISGPRISTKHTKPGKKKVKKSWASILTNFHLLKATGCNSFLKYPPFSHFPIEKPKYQIWPCCKIGQGHPRVIIWTN